MAADIKVPTLGESVTTATIARWIKKAGETVAADEPVVELETDKVTVEVNAPEAGVIAEIIADEGAEVEVGALLGRIGAARRRKPAAETEEPKKPSEAGAERRRRPDRRRQRRRRHPPARSPAPAPAALPAAAKLMEEKHLSAARIGARHRQGWPHLQGRRARLRQPPAGRTGARRRQGAARAGCPRRAREDDPPAQDHRRTPEGCAEHRRHAHHLQRGGYERHHGAAQRIQGRVREEAQRRPPRLQRLLRQGRLSRRWRNSPP